MRYSRCARIPHTSARKLGGQGPLRHRSLHRKTRFLKLFLDKMDFYLHKILWVAVVDGLGNPVEFLLSAGNDHDSVHAVELLEQVKLSGSNILADRAYGAQAIREYISERGASYVIPPQKNLSQPWPIDWHLYKERHLIECFFQKIKWFRRVATRYDKLDVSFLAFVYLAAIAILLL